MAFFKLSSMQRNFYGAPSNDLLRTAFYSMKHRYVSGKREMNNRKIVLALIIAMAISPLSIIAVKPAFAQTSIPTPYVPEFSVTYVASSYSVNYTNSETGVTTAYTYANDTVQIVILNQAFDTNALENGTILSLSYNVREEGHFSNGNGWDTLASTPASNSAYTVICYDVSLYNGSQPPVWPQVTAGGKIDFQVQASIGYSTQVLLYPPDYYSSYWTGQNGAWSNTQTITITNGSTTTSISGSPSYPTASPSLPAPNTDTIWAYAAGNGGSINPAGMVSVTSGGNQTFTIMADNGYQIADVKVNGVSVGTISSYTFDDVQSEENITAEFTLIDGSSSTPTQTSAPPNTTDSPQNPTTGTRTNILADFNLTQTVLFAAVAVSAALVIAVVAIAYKRKIAVKS